MVNCNRLTPSPHGAGGAGCALAADDFLAGPSYVTDNLAEDLNACHASPRLGPLWREGPYWAFGCRSRRYDAVK